VLVHDSRGLIGEVDLLFEAALVVVEIDGHRVHGRREAIQRDRTKQDRLTAAGYTVLRFTWVDLTRRPDAVVSRIRSTLLRQSAG